MFLYESDGKKIDVYSFKPDEEALIEYRKEIIEKQNIDELFYSFDTSSKTIINSFIESTEFDARNLDNSSNDWWAEINQQRLMPNSSRIAQKEILDSYIDGEYSSVIPIRTFIPEGGCNNYLRNYLVTQMPTSIYSNVEKRKIYSIENMINLPNNLCALQLLLNGKFEEILATWLDYSEPIQYFNAIKEAEISAYDLKNVFDIGLIDDNTYNEVNYKIETTSKILKKAKKIIN